MKSVFSFLVLSVLSFNASATDIDVSIVGSGGRHVCVVQNTNNFSKRFYLARAMTSMDAELAANNACVSKASFASQCGKATCQDDRLNVTAILPKIDIVIGNGRIDVVVSSLVAGSQCLAKNTNAFSQKLYTAKAPTELEANALALNACLSEASFASHCAAQKCEAIAAAPVVVPAPGGGRIRLPRIRLPRL